MTRTGSIRPPATWRLLFLSSGEFALSDYAATVGHKIKGGAEVRLVNLPADASAEYGLFDDIHDERDSQAFADRIKTAALQYYGTAFPAFLERFTADRELYLAQARACISRFTNENLKPGSASEVGRALYRFAIVAASGELATTMRITCWAPGAATKAAKSCFDAWIKARGGTGQADMQAALRQVKAFFELHGASRFESATTMRIDTATGNPVDEKIVNRAGYWKCDDDGEKLFLVFPEVFRGQVCNGYNAQSVAAELAGQDLLVRDDEKNLTKKVSVSVHGRQQRPRFYVIRGRIIED